jgi:hypothetical protein
VIDEYNQHMGGVDQANQYREAYTTHRPTQRNWFSLFYYGLDTALNNAYLIFMVVSGVRLFLSLTFADSL